MGNVSVHVIHACTAVQGHGRARAHAARSRCTRGVNKRHLSPGIALHFAFYALRSLRPGLCFGLCFTPSVRPVAARMCVYLRTCIYARVCIIRKAV